MRNLLILIIITLIIVACVQVVQPDVARSPVQHEPTRRCELKFDPPLTFRWECE